MKKQLMLFFLGLFLLGCAGIASATTIYVGTTNSNYLYTVDSTTLAATPVGATGVALTDIAFDASGFLWGITNTGGFYSVNKTTGATNLIGALGVNNMNALTFGYGTMYAASYVNPSGSLYKINTGTGAATVVGLMGVASSGDLAFDAAGTLYLTATGGDRLVSLDTSTGSANVIGNLGYSQVYGLAYDNPIMYGLTSSGTLLSVNTTTGAATSLGAITGLTGDVIWGATQMTPSDIELPVPEPTTMLLLGTGLVGVAGAARRKKKNQV